MGGGCWQSWLGYGAGVGVARSKQRAWHAAWGLSFCNVHRIRVLFSWRGEAVYRTGAWYLKSTCRPPAWTQEDACAGQLRTRFQDPAADSGEQQLARQRCLQRVRGHGEAKGGGVCSDIAAADACMDFVAVLTIVFIPVAGFWRWQTATLVTPWPALAGSTATLSP